jgi:tetratricopeptide (TPR) repeat protein
MLKYHILMGFRSIASPPALPQIFFGRDAELAHIIDTIFTNIGSHPARIAILGPGGYGKTTLANAVLTDDHIQQHYGDSRYVVPCESASSASTLLIELAKALGILESTPGTLWFNILAALSTKYSILCFDNFESAWDQAENIKHSVEELLSKITGLCNVTVLITMRGIERPAGTKWTQPFLEPLGVLNHDAAKIIWKEITGHYDVFSEKLLKAVDRVPLAVNLLAHLAQVTPSRLLWEEWNIKHTKIIKRGHMHRLSDLEYSIQLSIDSERMRANPSAKDLLGVLGVLPDGMYIEQLTKFINIFSDLDMISCLQVLLQCSLIKVEENRCKAHSLICEFCRDQGLILSKHLSTLESFYLTIACSDGQKASTQIYAEMQLEVHNTKSVLLGILKSNNTDYSDLINTTITFAKFCISVGDFDTTLLDQAIKFINDNNRTIPSLIRCFQTWGELYYYANDMENAKNKLLEAENLCLSSLAENSHLYGSILTMLGQIHLSQHKLNKAADLYQRALYYHKASNNIQGQGNDHEGLGGVFLLQDKLNEAEASFQEALTCHKASNYTLGQGNDHSGLGEIYLGQNKLKEAEAQFSKALTFHKKANDILEQGCDYKGLGDTYMRQKKLKEAEASFQKALGLHQMVKATMDQGNDYRGLGDIYMSQNELHNAESSYKNALQQYKDANNIPSQGNALNRLGHVYLRKSQFEEAQDMYEKALEIHKQVQAKGWEEEDREYLNLISSILSQNG